MSNVKNKVTIITGASKGIGAAVAQKLAGAGAIVVVNYAGSRKSAEEVVSSIVANGGIATAIQADISKPAEVKSLFDQTIAN
jgi:3-oxoacyl-[acyl-carrier protein] reductase